MSTELFANKFRVPTVRAAWHDYNGGAYFVTICTQNMENYFGEIVPTAENPQIELTEIGKFAKECIENVSQHNVYAEIPLYTIMPNHIHLVVIIDGEKIKQTHASRDAACCGSETTINEQPENKCEFSCKTGAAACCGSTKDTKMQAVSERTSLLAATIRSFKSAVTKYARQNAIDFAWQTRFHEHIVRDQNEMNKIAEYIENNPIVWHLNQNTEPFLVKN